MKKITGILVFVAVAACMGLAAISFGGGGGTQWFDWFGFEGWPAGTYKQIVETSDDGVVVTINSPAGEFEVGDSGHEEFGQRSLLATKAGILLTFNVTETGKGAREFIYNTKANVAGGVPIVYCWTDESLVGTFTRPYRMSAGPTYSNVGYDETSDERLHACMIVNGVLDNILVRK